MQTMFSWCARNLITRQGCKLFRCHAVDDKVLSRRWMHVISRACHCFSFVPKDRNLAVNGDSWFRDSQYFQSSSTSAPKTTKEVDKLFRAIDIVVKGHEEAVLQSYVDFGVQAAEELGILVNGVLHPKFIVDRLTALKSKHIFKKHKVQYEMRTHKKVIQIKNVTGTTADVYLEYIQRNLPSGVAMHVHKWELQRIPNHIKDEIKNNMPKLSSEDWEREAVYLSLCANDRSLKASDYEEYATTRRYLVGTCS